MQNDWDGEGFDGESGGRGSARTREVCRAYTTRRIPSAEFAQILRGDHIRPAAGDLVLVRIDEIGQHGRIQLPTTRRRNLFISDEVIVCYANRYAPRQFEAVVPKTLEPCHLVAAGGVAGKALCWHERLWRGPTEVTPVGLVADASGRRLNVADWGLPSETEIDPARLTSFDFHLSGTSMWPWTRTIVKN